MPYVERTVVAGGIRETKKMFTGRVHTRGVKRTKNTRATTQAQAKVNDRKTEENLRWILNANFMALDYHLVLHYYDKPQELFKSEKDKQRFLSLLRKECKARGIPWRFVTWTETKHMTNIHHHIILPAMDTTVLFLTWEKVVGMDGGNISIKPLDRRGNHAKLARYAMKETRKTAERYREAGKRYKRFSTAQGMIRPEPQYRVVNSSRWTEEPKPKKNYILLKDDDGSTTRSGIHEVNGWPWQEYFELWVGDGDQPGTAGKKKRRRKTS